MYIIKIKGGSYDDYYTENLFVTSDKKLASSYVNKYNRILKSYKSFYSKFSEDIDGSGNFCFKDDGDIMEYYDRWFELENITECYYEEIQKR